MPRSSHNRIAEDHRGGSPAEPGGLRISRVELERWVAEVGDAFYLLDLDRVRETHAGLLAAFTRRCPETLLAYSLKTNYTPALLRRMRELGCLAEVVSELEFELASRAGFTAEEVVVNGPLHQESFLDRLLLDGVRTHLDGWGMLETAGRLSRAHPGRRFRIGLRLSYPLPGVPWSRFGFEVGEASMARLRAWLAAHPTCELVSLHSHFPLAPPTPEAFRARIEGLADAAGRWFPETRLETLDLGGGFRPEPEGPPLAELAELVAQTLEARFPAGERPTLILEPGTLLVRDAMAFLCRVHDIKELEDRTLVLINGSNHSINTMMWRSRFDLRILEAPGGRAGPVHRGTFDIAGNTCMERKDLIATGVDGAIARGDYLVFDGIGSYSCALNPPFIHPCPPVLAREDGRIEVVKRRETVDDILATYRI